MPHKYGRTIRNVRISTGVYHTNKKFINIFRNLILQLIAKTQNPKKYFY
jgi:hypothetical protein